MYPWRRILLILWTFLGIGLWIGVACLVSLWPWTPYWWLRVLLAEAFGTVGFLAWHETVWTWVARKIVPQEQLFTTGPSLNPTFEHWGGPVE